MLEITASFITNKNKKTTVEPRVTRTVEGTPYYSSSYRGRWQNSICYVKNRYLLIFSTSVYGGAVKI